MLVPHYCLFVKALIIGIMGFGLKTKKEKEETEESNEERKRMNLVTFPLAQSSRIHLTAT